MSGNVKDWDNRGRHFLASIEGYDAEVDVNFTRTYLNNCTHTRIIVWWACTVTMKELHNVIEFDGSYGTEW